MSKNSFTYGNIDSMNNTYKFVNKINNQISKEQLRRDYDHN